VRFDTIANLKGPTLAAWAARALHPNVHLVTDGLASFAAASAVVAEYGAIIVSPHKSSDLEPFRWVNAFISRRRSRGLSPRQLRQISRHRYLAEARYRVNCRLDLPSLVGRLVDGCARTQPRPEKRLRRA
jgi:hypothetical protein